MFVIKVGPDAYIYSLSGEFCNTVNGKEMKKCIRNDNQVLVFLSVEAAELYVKSNLINEKFNFEIVKIDSPIRTEFLHSELLLIYRLLDDFHRTIPITNIRDGIRRKIDTDDIDKIDKLKTNPIDAYKLSVDVEEKLKEIFK